MIYKKHIAIGVVFIFSFFLLFVTLRDYGINWDEPVHYIRGQSFLRFFLTGKKNYDDLPKIRRHYTMNSYTPLPDDIDYEDDRSFRRSIYQYDRGGAQLSFSELASTDYGHPPIGDIGAALFNYVLYQKLGMMGDIESYHVFIVLVSTILVAVVFLFTSETYGIFAGLVASISLVLYPLFFAESHFNIKDPVEAAFYSLTLYGFYQGIRHQNRWWIVFSSIAAGIALGVKWNILFALFTALGWFVVVYWRSLRSFRWPLTPAVTLSLFTYFFIPLLLLFLLWPSLWGKPIRVLLDTFGYYRDIGYGTVYQPRNFLIIFGLNTYPLRAVLFTTPLIILGWACIGLFEAVRSMLQKKHSPAVFVVLWLVVPIVRVSLPGTSIYAGTRQIMEYMPAMAILAGIGAGEIARWFDRRNNRVVAWVPRLVMLFCFLPILLKLISMHPNENVYFNPLIGGLAGAYRTNFPDWGVTLGSVYIQGVRWLNTNASHGAKLTLVKGLLSNVPSIQLRSDINFSDRYYSGEKQEGEYIMEVYDYYWLRDVSEEKRKYLASLEPVHQVIVDGVPILIIWKNDKFHTRIIQ